MTAPPRPDVVTLGCRLNLAESETIRGLIDARDMVVVNTCGVTNEAVKQSRAAIRRAHRARPGAEIVATGCAAQIDPEGFAALPGVSRIVGNAAKLLPVTWGGFPNHTPAPRHARAFLGVQNGCDHACTFCAIPAGRGPSRSDPAGAVTARISALVEAGAREVVLTGVDLTSYVDGEVTLGGLVERILRDVPALPRLRLSSLDTIEIDDRLFDLVTGEPRVMPHLHLSLQAGDDLILKRMKRRHRRADAVRMIERLKAKRDIAIGADLIAGFPTEDEAMFANTLALIDDCEIVHAHVFPYSPRANTPAARMPQVAGEVARARAARLRAASARLKRAWLAGMIGAEQAIVLEKPGDRGHTPGFAELRLAGSLDDIGQIRTMRVTGATDDHLIGTPI
ncbi:MULTISPECIES: radical SAM protein [unclassified Sphingomonas]|uniref:MiaB/RimO family radical SAM methylthiotransferase n=1 Tax=unclassified Sphingomonas TaxID=196159 RepID=UPI0009277343|nr:MULTISPECIES: radical SAM protein [unclassified Sphingomonas]MBN8848997.1 radical SAM protein [Sphingomonas sp.]OJV31544.1 MAG: tRNA (N(6)-L-threonylcarbamoyladenosine(37)-C(2))-methylthiotransferase MtaB [Sphingomonas sp. 67-36]